MFLRLGGCNLACAWCDTKYAWDWARYDVKRETSVLSAEEIFVRLNVSPVKNLVITGGEPMLQQRNLKELTTLLHRAGWHTEMETAGTLKPTSTELVKQYNVSPKLANSGNPLYKRYKPDALRVLAESRRAVFKFVVSALPDFDEIDRLVDILKLYPVYIMPEGIDAGLLKERLQMIAESTVARGYYLSQRLHIEVHGVKRGV
jgi:organic radical activating enzyme